MLQNEMQIFDHFTKEKGLKYSSKRDYIVRTFLKSEKHLSAEDLYRLVKEKHPDIGYTTVYRTLKLMAESGLADTVDFNDGVKRFERKLGREFHAHFICTKCQKTFEAFDDKIKKLSLLLAQEKGFAAEKQRFEIFGICEECRGK